MAFHNSSVSRSAAIAACAAAFLTVTVASTSQAQTLDRAKLDQFLDRLAEKKQAMGSLTIARQGNVVYSRAIGYARVDATERKPLTGASRFRIGSITKMFTASMILQLVEEGKLELSDSLARFFPRIPNAGKITIAQILNHRSGIPNVVPQGREPGTPMTKDEMLTLVARGTPLFEPGTQHSYSNSGYFLLGLILERVTGKSYAEALEERITSRIGLTDTYVATGPIDVGRNESLTYLNTGSDWKQGTETHPSVLFGAGQIVSTPNDLARFAQALFDLKLLSQASLDLMTTMRDGEGSGMESFTFAGKTFYGHTGGGDNYGAWLAYLPEEKLAVAYATNAKVHPVKDIVTGVVDIYYSRPFQIPTFETIVVSPDVLDRYVGVYSSPGLPARFTITREGSTLYVRPGNQTPAALEATAEHRFQLLGGSVVFEFNAATGSMILKRGGAPIVFTKEK
jgi:CubicO group peptidase (beta-lactamase class C family)